MNSPIPRLVGMVHLLPLPGSPRYQGSIEQVVDTAGEDARTLLDAGFPALLVENFGDVPFHADRVPPETIAAMTAAATAVAGLGAPFGVNVLRNDGLAALGIAVATGADYMRVNVLIGTMLTDQGPIVGNAADLMRARRALATEVEVWADVMVKHAVPPPGLDAGRAAADTVERGLADAVIFSGAGTGFSPDLSVAAVIKSAVPEGTRIVVGSGATSDNLDQLISIADTVIVGSSIEVDGRAGNRTDPLRAKSFVERAAERGLV